MGFGVEWEARGRGVDAVYLMGSEVGWFLREYILSGNVRCQ